MQLVKSTFLAFLATLSLSSLECSAENCTTLTAQMAIADNLNEYAMFQNLSVRGFVKCEICDEEESIHCSTMLAQRSGFSPIIATHIHVATNGNGKTGNGPPLINFCGSKSPINDATPYSTICSQVKSKGKRAVQKYVHGNLIAATNGNTSLPELLAEILENPDKYYFNFHTQSSFNFWTALNQPPTGFARGQLVIQN